MAGTTRITRGVLPGRVSIPVPEHYFPMTSKHPTIATIALWLVVLSWPIVARAHDPGLSNADITVGEQIFVHLVYSRGDIEALLAADTLESAPGLDELAATSVRIRHDGGHIAPRTASARLDESDAVHFELEFSPAVAAKFEIESVFVPRLPRGHRQYAAIRDSRGSVLHEHMLDATRNTIALSEAEVSGSSSAPFGEFLLAGVEHISLGYDHVLFLVAVLIAGSDLLRLAKIISAFTVAHSITLGLAAFDVLRVPGSIVEPMIAASIVYVAVENLRGFRSSHRWMVTFGFGLVHGLGLASALQSLGLKATDGLAAMAPLLAFNLGVELGQIAILLAVFPFFVLLRHAPRWSHRLSTVGSVLVMAAGLYWLIERTVAF